MKLVLAEPKLFKDSISTISALVNEVHIRVDKNMLEIIAMDPANVAMVVFNMLSPAFVEYEVSKEKTLCINLDSLNQILRRIKPTDTVQLELDENKGKLVVKARGESSRTFHIALLDSEHKEQKIPELKFPAKVEMPSYVFDEAMEDMNIVAESVALTAEKNRFIIESESKMNAAKVEVTSDDEADISTDKSENIVSKYSLEYLKKIAGGAKLSDKVILQFGQEYPLKASFKIIDKLSLSIILAPRVMND